MTEEEKMPKPTKAQIAEAKKLKPTYGVINLSYSLQVVLPHDDALKLFDALKNAEQIDSTEYDNHVIRPLSLDTNFSLKPMSEQEYLDKKMSALFGVKIDNIGKY